MSKTEYPAVQKRTKSPLPRDICQCFIRQKDAELRSTWHSTQPYRRHSHARLSIGAIVAGQTLSHCGDKTLLLGPGDLILIPAGMPHSCNPVAGAPRSYHMLYVDTHLTPPLQIIRNPMLFQRFLDIIARMPEADLSPLLSALPACAPQPAALNPISQRLRLALLDDLRDPPSLDSLADRFSLRKETLIRHFRRDTGMTPGHFLIQSRIEYARARLRAGDAIADVAYQCGFADQSHFHKAFVSFTAATPRQYALSRSISDNKSA